MTKYDGLNAYTELEQAVAQDLSVAFSKRGFTIKHNGTTDKPAKARIPDIEMWNTNLHINVEVTKTTRSSADREMLAIADHLVTSKKKYPSKKCFSL